MAGQQNQGQPQGDGGQAGAEGDALDELDAALGQDGDGGQGGEPAEWTPPTREEWEAAHAAHQAALEAEKAKLARARQQAKRLREGRGGQPGAAAAEAGEEGVQPAAGPDPQLAVWQQRAVRASAKAELLNRGADPDMVDLALARLNPAEVDFSDDGDPELDAWVDELEERYPKLFAKPESGPADGARRPMGGVDQGRAAAGGPPKQVRFGERVIANANRAQGRRR